MSLGTSNSELFTQDTTTTPCAGPTNSVRVYCRVRPVEKEEKSVLSNSPGCVHFDCSNSRTDTIRWCVISPHTQVSSYLTAQNRFMGNKTNNRDLDRQYLFSFSRVFEPLSTQKEVYESVVQPLIADVAQGYNATVFVYGQTGSGKTYTMFGKTGLNNEALGELHATNLNVAALGSNSRTKLGKCLSDDGANLCSQNQEGPITTKRVDRDKHFEVNFGLHASPALFHRTMSMCSVEKKVLYCSRTLEDKEYIAHDKLNKEFFAKQTTPLDIFTSPGKSPELSENIFQLSDASGIVPRAVQELFHIIAHPEIGVQFELRLFFVEIYMEQVIDLLGSTSLASALTLRDTTDHQQVMRGLQVREDVDSGLFYVEGCEMPHVTGSEEAMSLIQSGLRRRKSSATNMNDSSSRSHCILSFTVKRVDRVANKIKVGKLVFVDLAGSEKVGKTKSQGLGLEEAKLINKSLMTLGLVIQALSENARHVPYRNSVLTKLLKDSLGGNFRTALVVCCSPSSLDAEETLSSLRFGTRAKKIQNHAVINRELGVVELNRMLKSAKEMIGHLKAKLQRRRRCDEEVTRKRAFDSKANIMQNLDAPNTELKLSSQPQSTNSSFSTQDYFSKEDDVFLCGAPFIESFTEKSNESVSSSRSAHEHYSTEAPNHINLSEIQTALEETRGSLQKAEKVNRVVRDQTYSECAKLESLKEENAIWEQKYSILRQRFHEQQQHLVMTRSQVGTLREEVSTLITQLEENLDSLRQARQACERSSIETASQRSIPMRAAERFELEGSLGQHCALKTLGVSNTVMDCFSSLGVSTEKGEDNNDQLSTPLPHTSQNHASKNIDVSLTSIDSMEKLLDIRLAEKFSLWNAHDRELSMPLCSPQLKERQEQALLQTSNRAVSSLLRRLTELDSFFHFTLTNQENLRSVESVGNGKHPFNGFSLSARSGPPCQDNGSSSSPITECDKGVVRRNNLTRHEASALVKETILYIMKLAQRIQDLEQTLAKETQSRCSLALELELAEKKLKMRQERIEILKVGLHQESQSNQELQAILEKERSGHQNLMHVSRIGANYWRRRFEELDENQQRPVKQQRI